MACTRVLVQSRGRCLGVVRGRDGGSATKLEEGSQSPDAADSTFRRWCELLTDLGGNVSYVPRYAITENDDRAVDQTMLMQVCRLSGDDYLDSVY